MDNFASRHVYETMQLNNSFAEGQAHNPCALRVGEATFADTDYGRGYQELPYTRTGSFGDVQR